MLNFYVISIGLDMVGDTDSSTTCRSKFKAPPIKTKLQNLKFLPKTWVAPNNHLTISDQNFKILTLGIGEQNKGTTKPQRQQLKMDLITSRNKLKFFERDLQVKIVKTSAKLQLVKS